MPIAIDTAQTASAPEPTSFKDKPAVADDYMYEFDHPVALPTIQRLGTSFQADVNPTRIAGELLDRLARATSINGASDNKLSDLFLEDGESSLPFYQSSTVVMRSLADS
jgi:hypothetical protein